MIMPTYAANQLGCIFLAGPYVYTCTLHIAASKAWPASAVATGLGRSDVRGTGAETVKLTALQLC